MFMNNGINQRQNEDNSILMLAAQRQLYNEAKMVKIWVFIISVLIPLVLAATQIFVKANTVLNIGTYIASVVSLFMGIIADNYINNKKDVAARIQQQFDAYVFQMPWSKRLFGENRNLSIEVVEKSRKLFRKLDEKAKLNDWYTNIVDEFSLEKGILFCQKENVYWDMGLRRRYRKVCTAFILCMIILILGVGIVQNESIQLLVFRISFIAPLLYWLYEKVKTLSSDIRRLNQLYDGITGEDLKTMDDLQDIQKDILEHRRSGCFIPNWFYSRYKNIDEITFHNAAEMEKL